VSKRQFQTTSIEELDRCELREVFQSMGVPIGENMLSELMDRFDIDNR
jgi:hypothetical protein